MTDMQPELGCCICSEGRVSEHAVACPHCGQPNPYSPLRDRVLRLLKVGKKINAIRLVREYQGCGLKEASEYVESL